MPACTPAFSAAVPCAAAARGMNAMNDTAYSFAAAPARLPDAVLERAGETLFARGADGAAAIERPFSADAFRATLAVLLVAQLLSFVWFLVPVKRAA